LKVGGERDLYGGWPVIANLWLRSCLRLPGIRPKRIPDPVCSLAGKWVRGFGEDAGRADLRVFYMRVIQSRGSDIIAWRGLSAGRKGPPVGVPTANARGLDLYSKKGVAVRRVLSTCERRGPGGR
jgi:hypothetical protein